VVPDWICEFLSPATRRLDQRVKRPFHARIGVAYLWFVDLDGRTLTVSKLIEGRWVELAVHGADERVRAGPFEAVELDLREWWGQGRSRGSPTPCRPGARRAAPPKLPAAAGVGWRPFPLTWVGPYPAEPAPVESMPPAGRAEEARAWLAKAEQHLAAAHVLVAGRGPEAIACFLLQQAAETALKALLVAAGETPRGRTTSWSCTVCSPPRGGRARAPVESLARWSDYAVAPRYPGFGDERAEVDLPAMVEGVGALTAEARTLVERPPG
jgi:hypothetical protein